MGVTLRVCMYVQDVQATPWELGQRRHQAVLNGYIKIENFNNKSVTRYVSTIKCPIKPAGGPAPLGREKVADPRDGLEKTYRSASLERR